MDSFTRDGLTFDVTDSGPESGELVILLHGFPQDGTAWDAVRPALNDAGLRTLAPDQRGYSPGARPRERRAYAMDALMDDTLALIDAAGADRAHVVGHDWGGALAWMLAARHPDRVASLVVLSTPHPAALAWAFAHSDQWRKSLYMVYFQLPWLPERTVPRMLPGLYTRHGVSAETAQRYTTRFTAPGALTGPLGWYRAMSASRSMRLSLALRAGRRPQGDRGPHSQRTPGARQSSRTISVPTTFVWGRRDFALGRAAAEKTGDYIAGDYRFIELDESHWLPEVAPTTVADAILDRVHSTP